MPPTMFLSFSSIPRQQDTTSTSTMSSSYSSSSSSSSSQQHHNHPISLGFTPGGSDALADIFPTSSGFTASATAFPSWPTTDCLYSPPDCRRSTASSYISDEDLFGLDDDSSELPYLSEAPAPPREAYMWTMPPVQHQQQQILSQHQPLPQLARPKVHFRKSPKKMTATVVSRRTSKALPTVREASI